MNKNGEMIKTLERQKVVDEALDDQERLVLANA